MNNRELTIKWLERFKKALREVEEDNSAGRLNPREYPLLKAAFESQIKELELELLNERQVREGTIHV